MLQTRHVVAVNRQPPALPPCATAPLLLLPLWAHPATPLLLFAPVEAQHLNPAASNPGHSPLALLVFLYPLQQRLQAGHVMGFKRPPHTIMAAAAAALLLH
jgi:hypothetical protein